MKFIPKISVLVIAFLSGLLCGCTPTTTTIPNVGIQIDEFNTDLKMSFNPKWNEFKVDEDFVATVELVSNIEVVAPLDFNLQLYAYDEDDEAWVRIENSGQYYGNDYTIDSNNFRVYFGFDPVIDNDQNQPISIFVLIYGYEKKDGKITDNRIGTYSIIKLFP